MYQNSLVVSVDFLKTYQEYTERKTKKEGKKSEQICLQEKVHLVFKFQLWEELEAFLKPLAKMLLKKLLPVLIKNINTCLMRS